MEYCKLTACELSEMLQKKQLSSVELTQYFLGRIKKINKKINSIITVCEKEAILQAKEADKRLGANDKVTPLTGIPVVVKDNMLTSGIKTTCGSKILENYVSPYNATVVQKLIEAGAVIIAKANMDEFAMGSSNENSYFGSVKNPWDIERTPGGSSGGSATSVAAGLAPISLGSDTGGSIRLPASFCGVCGLKPTYGRVSRYGLAAFASSLDQIGSFGKSAKDIAAALELIAGHDDKDSTSVNKPVPKYKELLEESTKSAKLKIALPKEYFSLGGIDKEILEVKDDVIKTFENLGFECCEVSLPHTEYAVATYYILATAEASSNLARYDGVRYGYRAKEFSDLEQMYAATRFEGFGEEVKRRIMLGTYVLSSGYYDAYYAKAQKVRTLIKGDFAKIFEKYDVILSPVSPTLSFKLNEKLNDPLKMYLSDVYTISANLAGIPALAFPCGFSKNGSLPIGYQLMGNYFEEDKLLKIAHAYQGVTDWHTRMPPES